MTGTSKRRWLRDLGIVVVLFAAITMWQGRNLLRGDEPAPPIPGLNLGDGRATLVYFFAPWCSVCRLSASNAQAIADWFGGPRFQVAFVALDFESTTSVDTFVSEVGLREQVVLGDAEVGRNYRVSAYPTYYVIDGDGRVRHASIGYSTLTGMLVRSLAARF